MSTTNSNWTRIGENSYGFGLERYRNQKDEALWRFQISVPGSGRKLVESDASIGDLRSMIQWCQNAIKLLETDGGRDVAPVKHAEEAA